MTDHSQAQAGRNDEGSEIDEEEEEIEILAEEVSNLEEEVSQMAQKILDYRTSLPDQLRASLSAFLASQRPVLPSHFHDAVPQPDSEPDVARPLESDKNASVREAEGEADKVELLKQKISSNASAMPIVLNRMKESMARIDKIESYRGVIIHPAFKRKWAG